ncbi:MAG: transcriptional regulator [Lautropia sp. SCN 69-89]|nr:MAG: transcriptional regulator [Lautropia sp. SCN 69-89]
MDIPILLDPRSRHPLQGQLYEQVRHLILGGRLKPGTSLASSRALATLLGVSRNTVMLAYERLAAEGYLQMREGIGTYVSFELPEDCLATERLTPACSDERPCVVSRRPIAFEGRAHGVVNDGQLTCDFWLGRPDPHSFPIRAWRRLVNRRLLGAGARLTEYGEPAGLIELRREIAERIGPARGIDADPEQIIVVGGCQEGLNLTARLLLREGAVVAIENPAYQGAANLYESYRARLVPVRVDDNGLRVADLPEDGVVLAYVTPSHQYPMGFTMPLERRLRLLDWARRLGAYVVEDDYDSDFRYRGAPFPALMGLDRHDSVIYMGSFSKSLGAGLRLGYLIVPRHLVGAARTAKTLLNNGHPWLEQAVLAEFLASGGYDNHLRRIRKSYAERRDCLLDSLRWYFGEIVVSGSECGTHIAWHLGASLPRATLMRSLAAERGVGLHDLPSSAACDFGGCTYSERTLLLGFSSLDERQIRGGIERVAAALDPAHGSLRGLTRPRHPRPTTYVAP